MIDFDKVLNYLKQRKSIYYRVAIPMELHTKVDKYITLCAYNGIKFSYFHSFIYSLGYNILEALLTETKKYSFMEMFRVCKWIGNMMPELIQYSDYEWFMDYKTTTKLIKLCKKKNVDSEEFLNFLHNNRTDLIGGNFLVTEDKVEAIFEYYTRKVIRIAGKDKKRAKNEQKNRVVKNI